MDSWLLSIIEANQLVRTAKEYHKNRCYGNLCCPQNVNFPRMATAGITYNITLKFGEHQRFPLSFVFESQHPLITSSFLKWSTLGTRGFSHVVQPDTSGEKLRGWALSPAEMRAAKTRNQKPHMKSLWHPGQHQLNFPVLEEGRTRVILVMRD